MSDQLEGIVIKAQSGFFTVQADDGRTVVAELRGRLKKERRDTDIIAVGDWVTVKQVDDQTGMIEEVAERVRALSRLALRGRDRHSRE